MPQSAAHAPHPPAELADVIPIRSQTVADDETPGHVHVITCSPLYGMYGRRPGWTGTVITDPDEIAAIRERTTPRPAAAWRRAIRSMRGHGDDA